MPRTIASKSPAFAAPAGCARRRRCRWSAGRACAPNSCPARSAAARRRAPASTRAWPRLRRRTTTERKPRAQERPLVDLEPVREQLRADAVEQEAGAAVQRAAGDRAEQVADQASARLRPRTAPGSRRSASWRGSRRDTARSAALRPIVAADFEVVGAPAPMLYQPSRCMASPRAGDQRAAEAVLRAALAADEAVRIGVDAEALAAADRGAVGILDARVELAPGRFAGERQVDRVVGVERPRVPACRTRAGRVAISAGIGEAGGGIVLGVARDRAGLLDGGDRGCPRAGRRCWRCPCAGRSRR